jgi:hypothetical protein
MSRLLYSTTQGQQIASKPTTPSITFPKWDGKQSTLPTTRTLFYTIQQDPFFTRIDWTQLLPGFESQNTHLQRAILSSPPGITHIHNQPAYENNGLTMFNHLI